MASSDIYLKDLRPVGEFYSDYVSRSICIQPSAIRHLNTSLIKEGGHLVNLNQGLDKSVERAEFKNKLFPMLCYLKLAPECYGQDSMPLVGDYVCTRTSLVQIASSAFNGEDCDDNRFDDGFLMVLFKREGCYYICEYSTESKTAKSGRGPNASMYAGIKFEDYCTLAEGQEEPDLNGVASSAHAYNAVFKATLVDNINKATHRLNYPAKIDCQDDEGRYAEIKFRKQPPGQGRSWWRIEMTWFLQCFFTDMNRIIVGLSDGNHGVSKVSEMTLDDLENAKSDHWDIEGCLEYLSKFLTKVKTELDSAPDNTYFYAFRQPNHTEYTITTYDMK